jgi:hypothetical protein
MTVLEPGTTQSFALYATCKIFQMIIENKCINVDNAKVLLILKSVLQQRRRRCKVWRISRTNFSAQSLRHCVKIVHCTRENKILEKRIIFLSDMHLKMYANTFESKWMNFDSVAISLNWENVISCLVEKS